MTADSFSTRSVSCVRCTQEAHMFPLLLAFGSGGASASTARRHAQSTHSTRQYYPRQPGALPQHAHNTLQVADRLAGAAPEEGSKRIGQQCCARTSRKSFMGNASVGVSYG